MSDKLCKFCLQPLGKRVSFNALSGEKESCWLYLEIGESAHIECYIKMCASDMPRSEFCSALPVRFMVSGTQENLHDGFTVNLGSESPESI